MMAKKETAQGTVDDLVARPQPTTPVATIVNDGEIVRCLERLVQIEEYRAELERARLEKDGLRFPPFKYKE